MAFCGAVVLVYVVIILRPCRRSVQQYCDIRVSALLYIGFMYCTYLLFFAQNGYLSKKVLYHYMSGHTMSTL